MSPPRRYNRAVRPSANARTQSGALSDAEIDRRIRAVGDRERARAMRDAEVRRMP